MGIFDWIVLCIVFLCLCGAVFVMLRRGVCHKNCKNCRGCIGPLLRDSRKKSKSVKSALDG